MKTFARLGIVLLAVASFTGCNVVGNMVPDPINEGDEITAHKVRNEMSPELQTVAHTQEQQLNYGARSVDTNMRQIWEDWDRFWLLDQPLHFSRYPIP